MITLGQIINWERLSGKPFTEFDGESADDVAVLGYVCLGTREYTLKVYRDAATNSGAEILAAVAREATAEFAYISQFVVEADTKATPEQESKEKESITQIVGALIMNGVDGNFLLSRGLEDLEWICKAYERSQQSQMEISRYWTYIKLSPWIDRNKATSPGEFLPFTWEKAGKDAATISDKEQKIAAALFGTPAPGVEAVVYEYYDGTKQD